MNVARTVLKYDGKLSPRMVDVLKRMKRGEVLATHVTTTSDIEGAATMGTRATISALYHRELIDYRLCHWPTTTYKLTLAGSVLAARYIRKDG